MDLTIQDKRKLIEFFQFLLNKEIDKPLGEMNSEAVDNYIKILLHLQDNHIELSSEFINEQVRKIFPKEDTTTVIPDTVKTKKNYFNKKKVWLVAACIAILVALFSVISVANDWNVFDFLTEKFGSVHSSPIEEELDFNGVTVIVNGKTTTYSNIEDALKSEEIDILYPTNLPDGIKVTNITFHKNTDAKEVFFEFNDPELFMEVLHNETLTKDTKEVATEVQETDHYTCYIYEMADINSYQIIFEHNGNTYTLSHRDKKLLVEIIGNLEEINNEN